MIAAVITAVPVDVDRDEAREAARRELSDPIYSAAEPSWFDRILAWVAERIAELFASSGSIAPGGISGVVVFVLLLVAIAVIIRLRAGKLARSRRIRRSAATAPTMSAAEHRIAAEAAFERGDLGAAVAERFRAIVAALEERGVLDRQSGRTADEIAANAGAVLPVSAAHLRAAARTFDDVFYGDRAATANHYRELVDADDAVRNEQPVGAA